MRKYPFVQRQFKKTATCLAWALVTVVLGLPTQVIGQEAEWIWWSGHQKEAVPKTSCHFRKSFVTVNPETCRIEVVADDEFELFVNGRRIGEGNNSKRLSTFDVSNYVKTGRNTIAVAVTNANGSTAALAARVMVKERAGGWTSHSTDDSWLTSLTVLPLWNTNIYTDRRWQTAQSVSYTHLTLPTKA